MAQAAPLQTAPAHVPGKLVREVIVGAHSGHSGTRGMTRHGLQPDLLQDADVFSRRNTAGFSGAISDTWPLLPLKTDRLNNGQWRKLLNPIFSQARMAAMEEKIATLAHGLAEGRAAKRGAEFRSEFAQVFPAQIFLESFGRRLEPTPTFVTWEEGVSHYYSPAMQCAAAGNQGDAAGLQLGIGGARRQASANGVG